MYSLVKLVGGVATKILKKFKFGVVCGAWPDPISRAQTLMKFEDYCEHEMNATRPMMTHSFTEKQTDKKS